jgi:hypothetical protein
MPDTASISQGRGRQVGYGCGREPPAREDYAEEGNSHLVPAHGEIVASAEPGSAACQPEEGELLGHVVSDSRCERPGARRGGGDQPSRGRPPGRASSSADMAPSVFALRVLRRSERFWAAVWHMASDT